jgi:hypothetical protein
MSGAEASFGSVLARGEQPEEHEASSTVLAIPTETDEVAQLRVFGTGGQ